jgi:hypothetical protein
MQTQPRSKSQVVADLATKLLQLPPRHPYRDVLVRMIEGLRGELREHGRRAGHRARIEDDLLTEAHRRLPPVERRRFPRRRALLGGRIVFRGGLYSMDCHIVGISAGGATLRPNDPPSCPKEFLLKPRLEPTRKCEVIWRRGYLLGVRYEEPCPMTAG